MSRGNDHSQWTAEQTLSYITGMVAADDNEDEQQFNQTLYTALSISYEYLTNSIKRKITWSLSLQKLAYEFIELAFITNMHSSIKEVFKSYRALTQGQYSESLKYVLEHYRDKKLETILEQEITQADLEIIREMPNIESDEISSEIILSSFKPELKQKKISLKNKLRIVWEGYKSIVETVRVNLKLEDVYMATLAKIFDFVDRYNRKHEFKTFCKTLRSGLQNAFNKREKSEHQKAIYIDIQKTDVNTRNIEIRMEQFKITTKLGLWQEAFQVLEDINNLMKVRRAPLKNSLRCQYFENLAILFKKSNYWHYHAFAYYNYYLAYLTKPKITAEEKRQLSNSLLLSVLCIPPATLESHQSKESQQKICSMMISSTKIPDKNQLFEMMASKGIVENSSEDIKQLWNFMFLQFNLSSLNKGLELLKTIQNGRSDFKELIEDILVYRQLISIAEVYQRIKMQSLLKLIPLSKEKIQKVLILCHHQKIIDFSIDESQGIIIFEDRAQQVNPHDELLDIFLDVAILKERERKLDQAFIHRKVVSFVNQSEEFFWKIRQHKIDEFKKKLKKPKQDLLNRERLREKQEKELRQKIQIDRKFKEAEQLKKNEEMLKVLGVKKIIIDDIISVKEQRIVRILGKKIQNLTDQQIENLSIETLTEHLEDIKKKVTTNKEAKCKKTFSQVDYLERQRRARLDAVMKAKILTTEEEKQLAAKAIEVSKVDFEQRKEQRDKLLQLANYLKSKIDVEIHAVNAKYDRQLEQYKTKLKDNFKEKIMARARTIQEETIKKKEQSIKRAEEQNSEYDSQSMWSFRPKDAEPTKSGDIVLGKKDFPSMNRQQNSAPLTIGGAKKTANAFESLQGIKQQKTYKSEYKNDNSAWSKGTKLVENKDKQPEKRQQPQTESTWKKKQAPAAKQAVPAYSNANVNPMVPPAQNLTPQPAKKEQGKWGQKPKAMVNVNEKREQKIQEKKEEPPKQGEKKIGRKFM